MHTDGNYVTILSVIKSYNLKKKKSPLEKICHTFQIKSHIPTHSLYMILVLDEYYQSESRPEFPTQQIVNDIRVRLNEAHEHLLLQLSRHLQMK